MAMQDVYDFFYDMNLSPIERVLQRLADLSLPEQGTENIGKIYAESFSGADGLRRILEEARMIVGDAVAASPQQPGIPTDPQLKEKP